MDGPAGRVEIWLLGPNRYRVRAPSGEQVIDGFRQAREVAQALAARPDK